MFFFLNFCLVSCGFAYLFEVQLELDNLAFAFTQIRPFAFLSFVLDVLQVDDSFIAQYIHFCPIEDIQPLKHLFGESAVGLLQGSLHRAEKLKLP